MLKVFGSILFVLLSIGCVVGKGKVKVSKDQRGRRDPKGRKLKNQIVREATKQQAKNPDPNALKTST